MNAEETLQQIINMKKFILFFNLLISLIAVGQNKDELAVLNNARSLNNAVFVTKDSLTLDKLFSDKLSYGHSSGKIENRQEAMRGILGNLSTYADVNPGPTSLWIEEKTAVTRYVLSANETNKEVKVNPLKLHIMLVWTKEKGGWKLLSRQAVKLS